MLPSPIVSLSWQHVAETAEQLAVQLKQQGEWHKIVAITRGGLIPAGIIAHHLNIKLIDTICVSSYRGTQQEGIAILKTVENPQEHCLVIDELVDTGETIKAVRGLLPHSFIATLYAKPLGKPTVDLFAKEITQETWLTFPWERD